MSRTNSPIDEATAGAAPASPQSSDLCLSCGLCCDGAIFDQAGLEPGELGLAAEGLELVEQDGRTFFRLGCPCLNGTACQIYGRRPAICSAFRCPLLRRLDSGDIDLPGALATVGEARRLADRADRLNDRTENRSNARQRWREQFGAMIGSGGCESGSDPAWLLAMTALNRFLDRHFRKEHQREIRESDGTLQPGVGERD